MAGTSVRQRPTSTSGGMLAVDARNPTVLVNNGSKGIEKNLTFLREIERRFQGTEKKYRKKRFKKGLRKIYWS